MRVSATEYEIDPRRFRSDRFYTVFLIAFWIVWTPLTLLVTGFAATGDGPQAFLLLWLCFGWLGVLLVPWSLLTRNRRQRMRMSAGRLLVRGTGLLPWSEVAVERDQLHALTLERHDEESVLTLNLLLKGSLLKGRVMLAPMVHPDGKEVLFGEIAPFLREHGFRFETRNARAASG
jgi:hypothetical protein